MRLLRSGVHGARSDLNDLCDLAERLGFESGLDIEGLDVDHMRVVLGLDFADQARLLAKAVAEGWTFAQLTAEVEAEAGGPVRSRRIQAPPRDELVDLYVRQQLAVRAIADHYGVSPPTASQWLVSAGIELRSKAEQIRISKARLPGGALDEAAGTEPDEAAITETGAGVPPASEATSVARREQLDHENATHQGASRQNRGRAHPAPPCDELLRLYAIEELSLDGLAAHYEVSRPVATRWLREADIGVRGRGARRRGAGASAPPPKATLVSESAERSEEAAMMLQVADVPRHGQQVDEVEPEAADASQGTPGRLADVVDGDVAGEAEGVTVEASGEPKEAPEPAEVAPHPLAKPAPPCEDLEALYLTQGLAVNEVA